MKSAEAKALDILTPWTEGLKNHEIFKLFQITFRTLKTLSKKVLRLIHF